MTPGEEPASGVSSPPLSEFFARLGAAPASLLMLDFDGTLAPFHIDPARARPYPGVGPLLEEIARGGGTRLALVTGRSLASILPLVEWSPLPEIWASHGRERRLAGGGGGGRGEGEEVVSAPLSAPQREGLARALGLAPSAGRLEEKPFSLAFHVRGLAAGEARRALDEARAAWEPVAGAAGLELLPFDGGLELRAPGRSKAEAVEALLEESPAGVAAAYLGDDETDEDAFRALGERGLAVLVRPERRETAARAWLRPPGELLGFLERWREARRLSA
ncbi:MAG: trehalose-phosphatase [bacterium]